jgi:hypothetical protein
MRQGPPATASGQAGADQAGIMSGIFGSGGRDRTYDQLINSHRNIVIFQVLAIALVTQLSAV